MRTRLQTALLLITLATASCSKAPQLNGPSNNRPVAEVPATTPDDGINYPSFPAKPLPPKDTLPPPPPGDGPCKDVYCTTYIAEINLEVVNSTGAHVMLDAFHTEDMSGNILSSNLNYYNNITQRYVVFNDFWVMGHQNTNIQVRFVGYKGGQKVVDEVYGVHTDCCHIMQTSGNNIVIVP